jgi:hypothetical protein
MVARLGLPLEVCVSPLLKSLIFLTYVCCALFVQVWTTFTELTHVLRAAEPLPLFRCWHQHQAEHVMAMVVRGFPDPDVGRKHGAD